ncbi:MAG: cysteine desulfurase family protein [Clostridia bacterium]
MIYYFDNCASTKVDDEVLKNINKFHTENYFNPSAENKYSVEVRKMLNNSRQEIADCLGANSNELIFTSGGTESNNMAIFGSVKLRRNGNIVLTATEHAACYNAVKELSNRGIEMRVSAVTSDGHVDKDSLYSLIDENTILVCVMHINNETGAINDIKEIVARVKSINPNAIFFSDGVQAVGKIKINLHNLGVDLYSFSGHKIHGSKGTGVLYVNKKLSVNPLIYGGGQESGMRSGTEYVAGLATLGQTVKIATNLIEENSNKYLDFKKYITDNLTVNYMVICTNDCSPSILSLAFPNTKSEVLLHMLEQNGIIVGTGSACSAKKKSRVAEAIKLQDSYVSGVMRISFSKYTNIKEVIYLTACLNEYIPRLANAMGVNN